jgi:hypothetical protein
MNADAGLYRADSANQENGLCVKLIMDQIRGQAPLAPNSYFESRFRIRGQWRLTPNYRGPPSLSR